MTSSPLSGLASGLILLRKLLCRMILSQSAEIVLEIVDESSWRSPVIAAGALHLIENDFSIDNVEILLR